MLPDLGNIQIYQFDKFERRSQKRIFCGFTKQQVVEFQIGKICRFENRSQRPLWPRLRARKNTFVCDFRVALLGRAMYCFSYTRSIYLGRLLQSHPQKTLSFLLPLVRGAFSLFIRVCDSVRIYLYNRLITKECHHAQRTQRHWCAS